MKPKEIPSIVNVKLCSLCHDPTEYYCFPCQLELCLQCKKKHNIDQDTRDHDVTIYRGKKKYLTNEKCAKHSPQNYEMFCKTCDIPVCFNCRKHRTHQLQPITLAVETIRKQHKNIIIKIKTETLYNNVSLLARLRTDIKSSNVITNYVQSEINLQFQKLKAFISDATMTIENAYRCSKQRTKMSMYIFCLKMYEQSFERSNHLTTKPLSCIKFLKKTRIPSIQIYNHSVISITENSECFRNVIDDLMCSLQITKRTKNESLLEMVACPVLHKPVTITGVHFCCHISCVRQDRIWVNDKSNLILINTSTGEILRSRFIASDTGFAGLHTVNKNHDLIYIDDNNINILCHNTERDIMIIKKESTWETRCVYSSPCTENLLVGMTKCGENAITGKIYKYNKLHLLLQMIKYDTKGQTMYSSPSYITENNNGDIVVSDCKLGIVVTSQEGKHRFSYALTPLGSQLLPGGICTDQLSHILVCDLITNSILMLDKDGQFMSVLPTKTQQAFKPISLSYDVNNNLLWVGSCMPKQVFLYKYTKRYVSLISKFHFISFKNMLTIDIEILYVCFLKMCNFVKTEGGEIVPDEDCDVTPQSKY